MQRQALISQGEALPPRGVGACPTADDGLTLQRQQLPPSAPHSSSRRANPENLSQDHRTGIPGWKVQECKR